MTDRRQTASDWLQRQRIKHLSRIVTYSRGSASAQVSAAIGRTGFEKVSDFGLLEKDEHRDFLILADDLRLPNIGKTTPQRGDRIRERMDSTVHVYEVMAPGSKDNHFTYVDQYREMLRVHTKEVKTE